MDEVVEGARLPENARPGQQELFDFPRTSPDSMVAPIHHMANRVILIEQDEIETWLTPG